MVKSYQPFIDYKNLMPGTKVKYWRDIYKNGTVTILSKDRHTWKFPCEWYQTKEGIRICSDEICHVFED